MPQLMNSHFSLAVLINTNQLQNELRNSNNMVILNTNYTMRMSEYSTWLVTKNQMETCMNDLWSSLNNLNKPVKLSGSLQTSQLA